MDTNRMRQFVNRWGSTLVLASFVITSVTGILLFFRVRIAPIEELHIWIGFLMIAGALFHIARNWHQFLWSFRRPALYAGLAITAVLCAYLSYPVLLGTETAREGGPPGLRSAMAISQAVANAPLSDLAALAKTDSNGLLARLSSMGVAASDPAATLQSVASASGKSAEELAAALLGGASDAAGGTAGSRD